MGEKAWNEWKNNNSSSNLSSINHDRTASFDLGSFSINSQDAAGRKECIEKLIEQKIDIITIIDEEVGKICKIKNEYLNDKSIRVELFGQLVKRL